MPFNGQKEDAARSRDTLNPNAKPFEREKRIEVSQPKDFVQCEHTNISGTRMECQRTLFFQKGDQEIRKF